MNCDCDLLKSIRATVRCFSVQTLKPVRSTPSLMKPERSIIRENRLDPDSPCALSQLIIVSRITKKCTLSGTVHLFRACTVIEEQEKVVPQLK